MKITFFLLCFFAPLTSIGMVGNADSLQQAKPRVFILTDISNEPDDEGSMVRFLVYANQFRVEGLVATTSMYLKSGVREDLIRRQIGAYAEVRDNLNVHQAGFPTAQQLLAVTASGQPGYGMAAVGNGKATKGSKLLTKAILKESDSPLWVCGWGGVNTLAQALIDAQKSVSPAVFKKALARVRVYAIADQDDAGLWLRTWFSDLFYICSPAADYREYYKATWSGISGDRHYANGPYYKFNLVENSWLKQNIIEKHGPLGALYPPYAFIMEGDTPSFLGLINNGLGWADSPAFGGWGGRYALFKSYAEPRAIWTNNQFSRDSVQYADGRYAVSDAATIWRWREQYQHDFAARMDWCITNDLKKANHNPTAILNNDGSKKVISINAKAGQLVELDASRTNDMDGNEVAVNWLVYKEAGSYTGHLQLSAYNGSQCSFVAPAVKQPEAIHIIMMVKDNGTPALYAYRRAVINVQP